METDVSQDIQDYWNEVKHHNGAEEINDEDLSSRSCDEGELETEWLKDAGLSHLTEPFELGREVSESELENALVDFSKSQSEAIKRRVLTLNSTIKQRRSKAKHRKADVRDVFKELEVFQSHSIGSQSRSVTPDSLDSAEIRLGEMDSFCTTIYISDSSSVHQKLKKPLTRVPSAPASHHLQHKHHSPRRQYTPSNQEIFRNYIPDVADSVSDGLRLISYQYLGTLPRNRSGSDPLYLDVTDEDSAGIENHSVRFLSPSNVRRLSRSHGNLLEVGERFGKSSLLDSEDRTWIDGLDESDIELLKPRFLAEVTSLFDSCNKPLQKRKPLKPHRKSETNVFGAPLNVLLEKDERLSATNCISTNSVPAILQKLVNHIEHNSLKEEGLLRVAGLKARTEILINVIENYFYVDSLKVDEVLYQVTAHDVSSALKKFLRDLPEPLLTLKFIYMFYNTHGLEDEKKKRALNLLVLLLPKENQSTLRYLIKFLVKVSQYQNYNKMGLHSIATIMAPSLFPPRFIRLSKDDIESQVKSAETCIQLTEALLTYGETLWIVPRYLISQLRSLNQSRHDRKENSKPKFFGKSRTKIVSRDHDANDGIIIVEAMQLGLKNFPVLITDKTRAGEVVLKIMQEATAMADKVKLTTRERSKPLSELAPRGLALSCFLSSAAPEMALQTHFLYECGGNIVQRQLEHSVLVVSVLKENPAASWRLQCRHRNCPKR